LKEANGQVIWTADVPGTEDKYVAFFNLNDTGSAKFLVSLNQLGMTGNFVVKDLWSKQEKGSTFDKFNVTVEPHASVMVRFTKLK